MSGCGCGQPVIVTGTQAPARVDVETQLLCDVLADGTVAATVLVEPIYDTNTGQRIATRTVDPVTGAVYTVQGTLQQCDQPPCTTCETLLLCDQAPGGDLPTSDATITVEAITPGTPGTPNPNYGAPIPVDPAQAQAFFDGGTATVPPGGANEHAYAVGAVTLTPDCGNLDPAGSSILTISARIDNEGTNAACGLWGRFALWNGSTLITPAAVANLGALGVPPGYQPGAVQTFTRSGIVVPNSVILAGDLYVELNVQVGQDTTADGGGCTPNGPEGQAFTLDQFTITAEPVPVTGCTAAEGEPVQFMRTLCRNCQGQVISSTDTELDGTTLYTVLGVPGPCVTSAPCESPTTPVTSVGLCLADGTPIAVTIIRDCAGTVTSEGWINLSTGAWTAGAVPVGTVACGESRSIQVSGTFCDIDADGEVVGLVLVEYTYDDTGAISSVRLVDAVTGGTYTPTGTVTVCPAGVEQPEQDVIQLCDVQADGTAVPMVRDYRRDENGAIVGHSDYTLDGAAYNPTGTVGLCPQCPSTVEVLRLCDLNPSVTPDAEGRRCAVPFLRHLVHDCTGSLVDSRDTEMDGITAYTPVAVVDCGDGGVPAQVELIWPQTGIAEDPAGTAGQDFIYTITNPDTGDTAEVRLHASRAAGGNCGAYDPAAPVFNNPTIYTLTLDAAAQEMTVFRLDLLDFDTFEGITQLNPPPDRVEGDVTWNGGSVVTANTNNVTAYLYWDNPPATITYRYGNTGGGTACTAVAFQGTTLKPEGCCGCSPAAECLHCETAQLCDTVSNGPTGVIAGAVGDNSGTADNGITWTANGDADPVEATKSTTDGLWWGIQTYPSTSTGPITFTLDAPAVVEFSVVMRHVANGTNTTQLPPGLEVVNLPAGYSYDAATGVLTVDSTLPVSTQPTSPECASYLSPSAENSARFLTAGPVTSVTADYNGQAIPVCGEIGPFRVGAITLNPPPKQFLRQVCRSCDGSVETVTDTLLDAVTPYTPAGTVGICAEPCRHRTTLTLCDSAPMDLGPSLAYTSTDPTPYFQPNPPDSNAKFPALVSGQPFWGGGSVTIASAADDPDGTHRYIAALIGGPGCPPCGDGGDVELTLAATVVNNGPAGGILTAGRWRLMRGTTEVAVQTIFNTPVNVPIPLSITATVPFADLASGDLAVTLDVETSHAGQKTWTASGFTVTAELTTPGCGTQFLRTLVHDCITGDLVETVDTDLEGAPYAPVEPVGTCQPGNPCTPECQSCETIPLCDTQVGVSAVLPSFGTPTRQWQTLPNGVRWMKRGNDGVLPGGWYVADSGAPERFDFDRPVSLRFSVRFSGPTSAPLRIPAGWYLDGLVGVQHSWNAATRTLSPTASVTPAGESTFRIEPQVVQSMQAPVIVGVQPSGQTSQYGQITATADQVTPFLRVVCRACSGTITSVTDTAVDGETAYTVLGTAGRCPEAESPECQDCETLVLCDDGVGDPARITGTGASTGTLSNGITWTSRGSSAAASASYDAAAGEGSWWPAIYSFPNATIGNATWTFDRPSIVEFSVYMRWVNYSGTSDPTNPTPRNETLLPSNVEPVYLPDGYHYDPVTHVVSVDELRGPAGNEPCSNLTAPLIAESARFRTTEPVSSITTRYLGVRVANCGVFGSQRVGAIEATPSGQFLRHVCRDCSGSVASVTDTLLDGTTPYAAAGAVGVCTDPPSCDKTVLSECTYHLPDTITGFDPDQEQFPGCWLGTAQNPTYRYGDRVTSWEGTYLSSTGTVSGVGFIVDGAALNFTTFTPALPANPTQSATDYVGTATHHGVTVTLSAVGGNGLMTASATQLMLNPTDRVRIEFSEPVPLVVTTSAFADPPTPHNERLCGVIAETVPWEAVKLADCEGVITTVDATTRQPLPATAVVSCDDACCQPVQVCIQQDTTQVVEFISNEEHRNDNTVDPVWKWTTNLNAANPPWYDMYQRQYSGAWSVVDSDTERPAWWVSPHPNATSAQSTPPLPNEGPTLLNAHWYPRAFFDLPDNADPASIRVQATVFNADQIGRAFRLNNGAWQTLPATATHNGTTYTFGPDIIPGAQAGRNYLYLDVEETVGGGAGLMVHLRVLYEVIPETRSWTRMVCCDGSVYYLDEDGARQDTVPDGWHVAPCFLPPSSDTSSPVQTASPVLTGIRLLSGEEVLFLSQLHPNLLSVSMSVLAGQGEATTDDGAATMPAGATVTWSVAQDHDTVLETFTGRSIGAGSSVLLNWTYRA